jgi:hypothetical protein
MGRGPGIPGHDSLALALVTVVVVASRACSVWVKEGAEPSQSDGEGCAQPALCTMQKAEAQRAIAAGAVNVELS